MPDWSGGFGEGGRPPNAKIPVKVHRNVSLMQSTDSAISLELLARPKISRLVIGKLGENVLLLRPGVLDELLGELKKIGHTPRITRTR